MGSVPLLSLEAHQDGGIRVVCGSAGWYPQPEVLWKAANGQRLPSVSQRRSSDERGLFEIQDVVVVSGKGDGNLSCVVRNSRLEQEQASSLHISGAGWQRGWGWLCLGGAGGLISGGWRNVRGVGEWEGMHPQVSFSAGDNLSLAGFRGALGCPWAGEDDVPLSPGLPAQGFRSGVV